MRNLRHFYALSLLFIFAQAINLDAQNVCSLPIDGYIKIGEFEGHGYYLSKDQKHWVDANNETQAAGYSLVSINSQEENDFIHGLVSEMILIGLSDFATEGEPYWVNGDPFDYSNFSECTWCGENDSNYNYGVMFPWDGKWFLDQYYRVAKYVIEVPCGEMLTSELVFECPTNTWKEIPAGDFSVAVDWAVPVAETDCPNDTVVVTQLSGPNSGDILTQGNYTVSYQAIDNCNSLAECTFNVSVSLAQDTSCGELEGFTYFGQYNGHGYYMSDSIARWEDARDLAEAAGGDLATVSSKSENDFIQIHLGQEMAYIGFNDLDDEGIGAWANGESVDFDQSYNNTDGNDFAIMNFWNGHWVMVNPYVYKRFIMEVNCGTPPTAISIVCPENINVEIPADSTVVPVSWDLPVAITTCPIDFTLLTQTGGDTSGTSLGEGNFTIIYEALDSCGNTASCTFYVGVTSNPLVAGCGDLPGYTNLGMYAGHSYYLSENELKWEEAKYQASLSGSYLATMNSLEENDFLQGAIGQEQPFIGFSDMETESEGTWANGDSLALDLSYGNSDINDYAVINFWAGTWEMVNQWVLRKYVIETDCMLEAAPKEPVYTTKTSIYDVYPNPAADLLAVRLTTDQARSVLFTISDARGQVFLSEKRELDLGPSTEQFDVSELPAGLYFIQMGPYTYKRFVKVD